MGVVPPMRPGPRRSVFLRRVLRRAPRPPGPARRRGVRGEIRRRLGEVLQARQVQAGAVPVLRRRGRRGGGVDVRGRVSWSLRRAFVASARGAGGRTAPPRQSWHITRKKGLGRARKSVGLAVGNHPRGSVTLPIAYGFSASDLQSLSHRRSWGVRWVRDPTTRGAHPTALDTSQSTHTHTHVRVRVVPPPRPRVLSRRAERRASRARSRL